MATQEAWAEYTELYDISTDIGKNQHYKIHTPTGVSHMRKLKGLYTQFKEYRYIGARIAWVPITTLPKDLLGVGYEAGEATVDPRDLINPILHKGYKGEPLMTDYMSERELWTENADATDAWSQGRFDVAGKVRRMTESGGVSKIGATGETIQPNYDDYFRALYYTSLTDSEWRKSHPREGFYQELYPLVRTVASTGQINPGAVPENVEKIEPTTGTNDNSKITDRDISSVGGSTSYLTTGKTSVTPTVPDAFLQKNHSFQKTITTISEGREYWGVNQSEIFTHEFERLGWMETSGKGTQIESFRKSSSAATTPSYNTATMSDTDLNRMPKVYMYLIQTPPAYKTKQFYRMSVTHTFAFRKFRQVHGMDSAYWKNEPLELSKMITSSPLPRGYDASGGIVVAGMKMYDQTGRLHADDFVIPEYEPALENTIVADGDGTTITKVSDGVS